MLIRHVLHLVRREPRRSAAAALGVAIGSALLVSVTLFGAASGTTVTRRALAGVPVDAQAVLAPGAYPAKATRLLESDPAVRRTLLFELVHFDGASATTAGGATRTSSGLVVGIDAAYSAATGLFPLSQGAAIAGQIEVSRDLATNLGVTPGDTLGFTLPGGKTADLKISGIVDITGADLLLGPLDAAHRAAGANPPTNVALTDLATAGRLATLVPAGATATAAPTTSPTGAAPVTGTDEPAVRNEIQLQYRLDQLPGSPTDAQLWFDTVRRRIERAAAGSLTIVDDAAASLEPIASDLAWGQILFVFLALPGIGLALTLSRFAAESSADATRRHAALLRARGASRRELFGVFIGAAGINALAGSVIGAAAGAGVAILAFGAELRAAGSAVLVPVALAVIGSAALATIAAAVPIRGQLASEVAEGRTDLQRARTPLWQRLYLDMLALAAGGAIYSTIGGAGVHPVLNSEGNPTVTLALTSFLPALLLWSGATLLLLRLIGGAATRSHRLAIFLRRPFGAGGELAGHAIAARAAASSRAIVLLALAVSFAASVLIFSATYRQQQRVDAELTLGADLRATPTSVTDGSALAMADGPGIAAVTPFVDRVVYVGSEAQDLLGIDPSTLPAATPLADTFFQGSTAAAAMRSLATRPDAVFVSAETAKDYSLVVGDRLRIRVPDAHGNLLQVDFRMAGVALEFPTAPKDAFLVANLDYVAKQTDNSAISYLLARQSSDRARSQLQQRLGGGWIVTGLSTTTAQLANSVTALDLSALVLLDIGFAILIAGLGAALFLLAGLSERRRELATIRAIGAAPSQMRSAVIAETVVIGIAGAAMGLLTGGMVGIALLSILAGIFDPPASVPAVPLLALAAVLAAVAVGLGGAVAIASHAIDRIDVLAALRER